MRHRLQGICLALSGAFLLAFLLIDSAENPQLADRYHARNRTSNFYARSAGKPEKANSGATVVGKKVVSRETSEPAGKTCAR